MLENAAEVYLKSQGKQVPARQAPVRPNLKPPKSVKVVTRVIPKEQVPAENSPESVIHNQTRLQETTVRTLTSTNELINKTNESSTETKKSLDELSSHVSTVEDGMQIVLGVTRLVSDQIEQLLAKVSKELAALREEYRANVDTNQRTITELQKHYDKAHQDLLGEIQALRLGQEEFKRFVATRVTILLEKITNTTTSADEVLRGVKADCLTAYSGFANQLTLLSNALSSQLQQYKNEQNVMVATSLGEVKNLVDTLQSSLSTHVVRLNGQQSSTATAVANSLATLSSEHHGAFERLDASVKNLTDTQASLHRQHLEAVDGVKEDSVAQIKELVATVSTMYADHKRMLEYFVTLADTMNAKQTAVKCSQCNKLVMKYTTTPQGETICANCQKK